MNDLLNIVVSFFVKKKHTDINEYYKASLLGNSSLAFHKLSSLLKTFVYEENILTTKNKDLEKCLENCDIDLLKLRIFLENLKGVNIDIIEEDLISY